MPRGDGPPKRNAAPGLGKVSCQWQQPLAERQFWRLGFGCLVRNGAKRNGQPPTGPSGTKYYTRASFHSFTPGDLLCLTADDALTHHPPVCASSPPAHFPTVAHKICRGPRSGGERILPCWGLPCAEGLQATLRGCPAVMPPFPRPSDARRREVGKVGKRNGCG